MDGAHFFSLDPDKSGPGDILYSSENGKFQFAFTIPGDQEIDALSSPQHPPVEPLDIYHRSFSMLFSIDGDSDIYEWCVDGTPIDILNGYFGPRDVSLDGHFLNKNPHQTFSYVHDDENDLGLADYDLDALESDEHRPPYPNPFPSHASGNVYFSTERSLWDPGDIYTSNWINPPQLYFDDKFLPDYLGDPDYNYDMNQIDAIVVFDFVGSQDSFDENPYDPYGADLILFSLAPGPYDPTGDNIYWINGNGFGGLLIDPHLSYNVDALDVHGCVPEPNTVFSVFTGLCILGLWIKKKKLVSN